jgi:hypothetical protein
LYAVVFSVMRAACPAISPTLIYHPNNISWNTWIIVQNREGRFIFGVISCQHKIRKTYIWMYDVSETSSVTVFSCPLVFSASLSTQAVDWCL